MLYYTTNFTNLVDCCIYTILYKYYYGWWKSTFILNFDIANTPAHMYTTCTPFTNATDAEISLYPKQCHIDVLITELIKIHKIYCRYIKIDISHTNKNTNLYIKLNAITSMCL